MTFGMLKVGDVFTVSGVIGRSYVFRKDTAEGAISVLVPDGSFKFKFAPLRDHEAASQQYSDIGGSRYGSTRIALLGQAGDKGIFGEFR